MGEEGGRVLPSETNAGTSFTAVIKEKWPPQGEAEAKAAKKKAASTLAMLNLGPYASVARFYRFHCTDRRTVHAMLIVEMQSQLFSRNQARGSKSNCIHLKSKAFNFVLLLKSCQTRTAF